MAHPSVRHEQPSYTRSEGGEREHKHRQKIGIHGTIVRILELYRRRERIASVRHRLGSIRTRFTCPTFAPARAEGTSGTAEAGDAGKECRKSRRKKA